MSLSGYQVKMAKKWTNVERKEIGGVGEGWKYFKETVRGCARDVCWVRWLGKEKETSVDNGMMKLGNWFRKKRKTFGLLI